MSDGHKETLQRELQAARDEVAELQARLDALEIVRQAILEHKAAA